jgi:hypothetical protein
VSDLNAVSCENCLFFERHPAFETQIVGECRVAPPAISTSTSDLHGGIWPLVTPEKWCGCFVWDDLLLRGQYKDAVATFRAAWGQEEQVVSDQDATQSSL